MKKLNLLTLICALLMGVSLTSCLDSGNSGTGWDDIRTVRVYSTYGSPIFIDVLNNRYIPTSQSLSGFIQNNPDLDWSDYKMMNIYFNYPEETGTNAGTGTSTSATTIELVAFQVIEMPEVTSVQTTAQLESMETAPVIPLEQNLGYGINRPQQWDEKTVLAYTGYYCSSKTDKLSEHTFGLVYVMDEITSNDATDLVVYLCHNRGDDEETTAVWAATCGFDLTGALTAYRNAHSGNNPENIIFKAKTTNYASTTLPTNYSEYKVEYKTFEELYPSATVN